RAKAARLAKDYSFAEHSVASCQRNVNVVVVVNRLCHRLRAKDAHDLKRTAAADEESLADGVHVGEQALGNLGSENGNVSQSFLVKIAEESILAGVQETIKRASLGKWRRHGEQVCIVASGLCRGAHVGKERSNGQYGFDARNDLLELFQVSLGESIA